MGSKWVMGMIAVISVAAVAGVGFAAYSSTAVVNVSANAGSFYLVATADLTASSLAVGSCNVIPSGNSVTIQTTNMLPGDYCNFTDTWTDAGSLPGTLVTWSPAALEGAGCAALSFLAPWTAGPYSSVAAGGVAGAGYWNITDSSNGAVAGTCTGTVSMTYAAA
jgi:hypothetical protein